MPRKAKKNQQILYLQDRVRAVCKKGLSPSEYRSKDEIARRLKWSVELVDSTINQINQHEQGELNQTLSYNPRKGGGWKLAHTWVDDKEFYMRFLSSNINTRIASMVRHLEVAAGLVIDKRKIPRGLSRDLAALQAMADKVQGKLPSTAKPVPAPVKAPRRNVVIR